MSSEKTSFENIIDRLKNDQEALGRNKKHLLSKPFWRIIQDRFFPVDRKYNANNFNLYIIAAIVVLFYETYFKPYSVEETINKMLSIGNDGESTFDKVEILNNSLTNNELQLDKEDWDFIVRYIMIASKRKFAAIVSEDLTGPVEYVERMYNIESKSEKRLVHEYFTPTKLSKYTLLHNFSKFIYVDLANDLVGDRPQRLNNIDKFARVIPALLTMNLPMDEWIEYIEPLGLPKNKLLECADKYQRQFNGILTGEELLQHLEDILLI